MASQHNAIKLLTPLYHELCSNTDDISIKLLLNGLRRNGKVLPQLQNTPICRLPANLINHVLYEHLLASNELLDFFILRLNYFTTEELTVEFATLCNKLKDDNNFSNLEKIVKNLQDFTSSDTKVIKLLAIFYRNIPKQVHQSCHYQAKPQANKRFSVTVTYNYEALIRGFAYDDEDLLWLQESLQQQNPIAIKHCLTNNTVQAKLKNHQLPIIKYCWRLLLKHRENCDVQLMSYIVNNFPAVVNNHLERLPMTEKRRLLAIIAHSLKKQTNLELATRFNAILNQDSKRYFVIEYSMITDRIQTDFPILKKP